MDTSTRFETQELGIREISPKMVEQQLQGDKDVDLVFKTFWARPNA
jgi:hypothetical protein